MKMILAFVNPVRTERVTRALEHIEGFSGVTVSEAKGFGHEKLEGRRDLRDQLTDFTPTSRLEALVPEALVDRVVAAIVDAAHTGQGGDGHVVVVPVERGVRIKTRGPIDEDA